MLYSERFRNECTKELEKIINKKGLEIFDTDDIIVLLYLFPLIERLVVEILDLSTLVNIECKEQGVIRTVNSLLQHQEIVKIIDPYLIKKLSKYFSDDGIRNKMMHYNPQEIEIKCAISDVQEVKEIAISLANLYNSELKKNAYIELDEIKTI